MSDNHDFCRVMLRMAREGAAETGVKIPPLSSCKMFEDHYAVYLGDDWYEEYGACCAFYARAEAIDAFMRGERSPLNRTQL